ncbi:MAG: glycosyltransferase family 2 protein [Candidatus Obscuribacterales bacterium]|nr:glycosyltransferase family 2 protein [Candidatus Obscuribacterales bacterium]
MKKPTLSVVIIALNEERHIGDVLAAATPLADEIILVDSGSTDRTIEIAKSFNAKVIHQDWLGYGKQKNFAIAQATSDWILSLDGDEIMTPELVAEIGAVLESSRINEFDGFKIPRMLHVGGVPIAHGGFYPDRHLRLFRRGKGKFNDRLVHESVVVDGPLDNLNHALKNMAYENPQEFAQSMENFARLSAKQRLVSGASWWHTSRINELIHPGWTFVYRYFARLGFLDGSLGLQLQLAYSDYVRNKIKYLRDEIKK